MTITRIIAAAGLMAAALGIGASAEAQRYDHDRGRDHGRYEQRDRGHHYGRDDRRHYGRDRHQRCRTEWRHHHRVRICR